MNKNIRKEFNGSVYDLEIRDVGIVELQKIARKLDHLGKKQGRIAKMLELISDSFNNKGTLNDNLAQYDEIESKIDEFEAKLDIIHEEYIGVLLGSIQDFIPSIELNGKKVSKKEYCKIGFDDQVFLLSTVTNNHHLMGEVEKTNFT